MIPVFLEQRKRGKVTITDPRMTRFWITLEQGVTFRHSLYRADARWRDFRAQDSQHEADRNGARPLLPGAKWTYVGIRPGEKLHEVLVSEDEARNTVELEDMYVIQPAHPWWRKENWNGARALPEGFRYTSDSNPRWLSNEEL